MDEAVGAAVSAAGDQGRGCCQGYGGRHMSNTRSAS